MTAPGIATHELADAITVLAKEGGDVSWIVPGPAQLVLGGPSLQPAGPDEPLAVRLLEDQGSELRVGVILEHVRFALWTERARLLGIAKREQRVASRAGGDSVDLSRPDPIEAVLRPSAHVRRLGHQDGWAHIRYFGAVEVEGWVPESALVDRAPADHVATGRIPTGRQTLMVTPGAVIRTEPQWVARELAVMANGYFVDTIRDVDGAWVEVLYEDGDVLVHGFVTNRDPPGRVHRPPVSEIPPSVVTPNALVTAGTCLHASAGGEPVGFIVGDQRALLEPADRPGWYSITVDTPWGPIAFAARGPTETELVACAPASRAAPAP